MLRGNTVPQPESFRILSLAFHNWLCPSDSDEALFWILMRMRHIEYLNCNHKDAAFMEMSSIQVTDLKIHTGTNGKDQSNLHLEAGKKTTLFSTQCHYWGRNGWRWKEEKPCKDLGKNFKAWAPEWKVHKGVLESFVNNWTNKFITRPFCVASLQSGLYL